MTSTSIRKLTGQEMKQAFYDLSIYSFQATPPMPEPEKWLAEFEEKPNTHCWAAFENGRAAAIMGYTTMTQNVRGKLVPMGAVWGVAAAPETRRKGHVRQAMKAAYTEMREEGMPVSGLYPFRESFYERLGYISYTCPYYIKFPLTSLSSLLKLDLGGSVERIPAAEGIEVYRAYLEEMRARVHGMAFADSELEGKVKDSNTWMLLVRELGQVTGIMMYQIVDEGHWKRFFNARRFYYTTPTARMRMLEWMARHVDQVERAEAYLPPWERPERWLVDLKSKIEFSLAHPPMGRVIDVEMLNGIPCGPRSFSVTVKDPFCPWNEGAWRFESVGGTLHVQRAASAECELAIQGLSGWLFGSLDPVEFAVRGFGSTSPEIVSAMGSMLPLQPVYMHEFY